jgi:hypothetical protein
MALQHARLTRQSTAQLFTSDIEDEMKYARARRMFELGAPAASVWPQAQPVAHGGEAAGWQQQQPAQWVDWRDEAHFEPAYASGEHLPHAWHDGGAAADAWDGGAAVDAWDGGAPVLWDYAAAQEPATHWQHEHENHAPLWEPGLPPPPCIALAPIPPGWGRRIEHGGAAAQAPAARAADVDAVSQLLSAVLLERRAQQPVQPRHEAAPPPAVMRHERLPAEPPSAATGGSAWPWPSRVEPGPSVPDGLRAWGDRAGHHHDGAVDVPPPAQALYELSDDSSDASGSSMGGALDAMRDQPPVRDCEPLRAPGACGLQDAMLARLFAHLCSRTHCAAGDEPAHSVGDLQAAEPPVAPAVAAPVPVPAAAPVVAKPVTAPAAPIEAAPQFFLQAQKPPARVRSHPAARATGSPS